MRSWSRQDWVLGSALLLMVFLPMGVAGGAAYIALALVLGWAALKHRCSGWGAGLLFAVLVITLPAWVGAVIYLFAAWHF
jgi:hypothetical protein